MVKKRYILILAVVITVVFVLIFLSYKYNKPAKSNDVNDTEVAKYCVNDGDCVPDSCCHPNSCVNVQNAPLCQRIGCTMECAPDTLDCGQASCSCINNKCSVVKK